MPIVEDIDPEVNRSDLSGDPLGFCEKRFAVIRELWDRVQAERAAGWHQVRAVAATSSVASC